MTLTEHEFLQEVRLDRETVHLWISERWLAPGGDADALFFTEIDVARARLIVDLRHGMGVNDEGVGVILHLLDQMHGLRRALGDALQSLHETSAAARDPNAHQ